MRYKSNYLAGIVAAVAALGLVAACSSSGGGSDKSTGNTGAGGGATGTSSSAVPAGSTITVGGLGPIDYPADPLPQLKAGEQAAIDSINAAGGVNGHKLKLQYCDTKGDANGEFGCMRQLVQAKVAAILAPEILADGSGRGYKLAVAAHIPVVGGQGLTPIEFNTPGVYPTGAGIPGWAYGQAAALVKAGAKKIALFGTNDPGSLFILQLSEAALKSAGITPVRWVKTDPNSDPTMAEGAAKAIAGGVDGVIYDSNPPLVPKAFAALRAAGFKGLISSITAIFPPASITALGAQADGVLLTAQLAIPTDTSNPAVNKFLADMKSSQPGATVDEVAENGWTAVQLVASVAKSLSGDVSNTALFDAFANLSTPVDLGIIGPYQVKGATPILKDFPDIYNATVANGVVKNGVLVTDGHGLVDPFTLLSGT
jgi:branched-chain amino acid transport system substrate-binding protein